MNNQQLFYSDKRKRLESYKNHQDPINLFKDFFSEALQVEGPSAHAFSLSTIHEERPSSRMVLMKEVADHRLIFYSHYLSPKGSDIEKNKFVSTLFFWPKLETQIRIEGVASKISREESDLYFRSRDRDSQIGAHISKQSQILGSYDELLENFEKKKKEFESQKDIPRPHHWGGFSIKISTLEFWVGRPSRLNERLFFRKEYNQWVSNLLWP